MEIADPKVIASLFMCVPVPVAALVSAAMLVLCRPLRRHVPSSASPLQFRLIDIAVLCTQCGVTVLPLTWLRFLNAIISPELVIVLVVTLLLLHPVIWVYAARLLSRSGVEQTAMRIAFLLFLPWMSLVSVVAVISWFSLLGAASATWWKPLIFPVVVTALACVTVGPFTQFVRTLGKKASNSSSPSERPAAVEGPTTSRDIVHTRTSADDRSVQSRQPKPPPDFG